MNWSTLTSTVIGAVLGIGGAFLAQWLADRRATEHEKRVWDREDTHRTFDDRRAVYVEFYERLTRTARCLAVAKSQPNDAAAELEEGWFWPLFDNLNRLRIFATESTAAIATEAYTAELIWGHALKDLLFDKGYEIDNKRVNERELWEMQQTYRSNEISLLQAIRDDLGVPDLGVGRPG